MREKIKGYTTSLLTLLLPLVYCMPLSKYLLLILTSNILIERLATQMQDKNISHTAGVMYGNS
jgi:hypothetical protein